MSKTSRFVSAILFLALVLSACNLPGGTPEPESVSAGAVLTVAAQTVEANLTQAAAQNSPEAAESPTNTAVPTATLATVNTQPVATSTQECNQAQFIKDVNVPDGAQFAKNEAFTKTWRLKNTGSCSWSGYSLVFDSGDAMSGPASVPIGTVAPGQEVDLSVNLTAPNSDGTYRGYWRIKTNGGVLIPIQNGYQGQSFYVEIKVGDGGGNGNGPFAVTSVNMSVSGGCGNFQIKADITTNGAGSVTYKWIRSDGATDTNVHPEVVFDSADTKSVTTSWMTTASGDKWMDIYIDNPNHQQFGRANFSCP